MLREARVSLPPFRSAAGAVILWTLTCFAGTLPLQAQIASGAAADNYQPLWGRTLNPASISDSRVWLSLNLAGANGYLRNNVVHSPSGMLLRPYRLNEQEYDLRPAYFRAHAAAEVQGPSLSLVVRDHAFAVHTAARGYGNIGRIPAALGRALLEGDSTVQDGDHTGKYARFKTMAWLEYGLTYARILSKRNNALLSAGMTLSRVTGVADLGLVMKDGVFGVDTGGNVVVRSLDGRYAFAEPGWPDWSTGRGIGLSVGGEYKRMNDDVSGYTPHYPRAGCLSATYIWKLGAALTDIGWIRFTSNAYRGKVTENTDFEGLVGDADLNNPDISVEGSKFSALLPVALSLQYDRNLGNAFHAGGMLLQRLVPRGWMSAERANVLSLSARYETRYLSAALPITFYEYHKLQVGLMVRLAWLTVGTDHLAPFFFRSDIYAASAYFSLTYRILRHPACRDRKQPRKRYRHKKDSCPQM